MRNRLKILLVQIREHPEVIIEEQESFARFGEFSTDQLKILNVFKTPHFGEEWLSGIDAVFVGGASEASMLEPEKYPCVDSIKSFLNICLEKEIPTFSSCFGFQAALMALGGSLVKDMEDFEMGTYPMKMTEAALNDPIYKNIPNEFYAVSVHQERAHSIPEGCELLAYTDFCTHSFRAKGKPFWAFQFHPELDKPTLDERLSAYQEVYTENSEHLANVIASLEDVSDSNRLVKNFIDYLVELKTR